MSKTVVQLCQEAADALSAGDAKKAFTVLRPALEHPGAVTPTAELQPALEMLARVLMRMEEDALAETVKKTVRKLDDVPALYKLGCAFLDGKLPAMAATVFTRANRLKPGREDVVAELVCALEELGRNAEALEVLNAPELSRLRDGFVCSYLTAFNALMCGNPEEARQRLPKLLKEREPEFAEMAARLHGMLQRLEAVTGATPLTTEDLRGWHFVINGSVLLHVSPHGWPEMHGRYALTQDSDERCREGMERLRTALTALALTPPTVFFPEERESRILARATAEVLGVPARPLPAAGTLEPGLLVAYDLAALDEPWLDALAWQRPGQVLWTQASPWVEEPPFAADLTTYLYQVNHSPWAEHLDLAGGHAAHRPPRTDPEDVLVRALVQAPLPPAAVADLPELTRFCQAAARASGDAAAGALRRQGERRQQWFDSPVKSHRFQ